MKGKILILVGLVCVIALSGCVTAKVVERERVDQQVSGNQGYLTGSTSSTSTQPAPTTRQFIKVDIELPPYEKKEEGALDKEIYGNEGYLAGESDPQASKPKAIFPSRSRLSQEEQEEIEEYLPEETEVMETQPALKTYAVKKNDSLWKIAQRPDIYGNGNKWKKIYDANKDKIKNPNRLRPGIILIIPQD